MLWFDGAVSNDPRTGFDLRDRGLLLGDGLFETLAVANGRAFMLDAHLDRLLAGAAALNIPVDREALRRPVEDLTAALPEGGIIRLTLTRGAGPRGLRLPIHQQPTVFAAASAPWSPNPTAAEVRLATARIRRNSSSPTSRYKTLAYLDNVLAVQEALDQGADDALLLAVGGQVACTSAGNIFIIEGERLLTPSLDNGVLPGITRALVLNVLAPELGLIPQEVNLPKDSLFQADAVLLSKHPRSRADFERRASSGLSYDGGCSGGPLWRRAFALAQPLPFPW
ncbi:aminotransferase class IV [Microvirga lotononidis]|uniref:Probable branched-chain-amino-acid aminotransferase n=1 Tax=Microvirga lotononidis TaxID=864069 RepID=I4Z3W5_9HYPH|nr:aminotransferase class IV [Microvirga lotononidis]EIM30907.1 branched-chain amino acid aminotransferase/4-amino-4-deoxychorismate lyase [Microvirga lotononidis]WQO30140.1 aminotransferase class IV [Microvirga lotononidis]